MYDKSFKEQRINNYISDVFSDTEVNIDVNKIKRDLHQLLGEEPGVQINYKQDIILAEDGTEPKRMEKLDSITIVYSYGDMYQPSFDKLTYYPNP
jgi:hypothetical protein